jgi:ABC-type nitrate/sulfonate/bicarbonate transport system substrate-binding protein
VDLIPGVLPFSLDPELRKIGRPLFKQNEAIGETEMIVWAVRKPFIDKNRAALVDFMEDSLRIVRWYLDPANQKAAAEIAAKVTKQPAERFDWVFTEKDYYRDPNMLPNLQALQKNLDMTTDLGFVKGNVDVAQHTDLSLVKEAAARIK